MSELEHNIDDELLSAYLDDELSPEERAKVEVRLASDPAARQMLDQLRAASLAMQGLPHETVGEDLRDSILRRAEAAMLTAGSERGATAAKKSATADSAVTLRDSLPRITIGQTRRGWVWAALAMAAGLMIMVFQPGGDENGNSLPQVAASRRLEEIDKVAATDGTRGSELHLPPGSEPAAPPAATDFHSFAIVTPPTAGTPIATGTASPAPTSIVVNEPAIAVAPKAPADASSVLRDDAGTANYGAEATPTPGLAGRFSTPAEQSSREAESLADVLATRQSQRLGDEAKEIQSVNGGRQSVALNGPTSASGATSGRGIADAAPQGGARRGGATLSAAATREAAPADALSKSLDQTRDADFVVVRVVATPEALRNKSFDELLAKNGVQLEESTEAETASTSAGEGIQEKAKLDRAMSRTADDALDASGKKSAEDVILVAAPQATIDSCLSELKRDEVNYLGIEIDDPAGRIAPADAKDKALVDAETPARSLADDLGARYNRGKVPSQKVEEFRDRYYFKDSRDSGKLAMGGERIGGGQGGFGGGGGAPKQEIEQLKQRTDWWGLDSKLQQGPARARRIQLSDSNDQPAGNVQPFEEKLAEDRSSSTTSLELGALRQPVRARAETAGGNVRVLFLLSPGTQPAPAAPPSPAAANRQE